MEQIINQAYDLADALKENKEYKELIELKELINDKYKDELKKYKDSFKKFDFAYKMKDYYPDFKKVSLLYQECKKDLFEKEEVKRYFELEKIVNDKLNIIAKELISAVSNYSQVEGAYCKWK